MNTDRLLELLFSQSLDGFFFMMLDEPIVWDEHADKERLLDYAFDHQRVTMVNDAMLMQYGTTRDQFVGLTPRHLFQYDLAYGRRIWREFFDRGQWHVNTKEQRFDGTPIDVEGDYTCLYDDARRIIGHFGIQRDVTEQVRLQAAVVQHAADLEKRVEDRTLEVQEGRQRLHAVVNALPDLVFVADRDGRYLEIVTEDDRMLYRTSAEHVGRRFHDVLPTSIANLKLKVVQQTLQTSTVQVVEYPLEMPDGQRWFEARSAPLRDPNRRERANVVMIVRDITERKRAGELESHNVYLREALETDLFFGEIIGRSAPMQEVCRALALVAETDASVLLLGETGTGKELLARAIHRLSRRKTGPMVKLNCGALPATLVESELFGHERGAFTGALQQKKGRFELAHRGTILLDEVGDLPLEAQVKLLRVLQEHEFERVGGTQPIKVDTRVIAATNRNLDRDVQQGAFRPDLYFRLNIFPILVPPLRERPEDIPLLAEHFLQEFRGRIGRRVDRIDPRALERLTSYGWPGNVRELANILERAVILCQGPVLQEAHLGLPTVNAPSSSERLCSLEEAERRHILMALESTGGVLAGPRGAAKLLGLNRSTLWSRMKKLGIVAAGKDEAARA